MKPKLAGQTQREHNLEADPRAELLVEHWDRDEWSRLWRVRAELRWEPAPTQRRADEVAARLAEAFP